MPNNDSSIKLSREELLSNKDEWAAGDILWQNLTASHAIRREDGYDEFHRLIDYSGNSEAGIRHDCGVNAEVPPVWLIYIAIENGNKNVKLCHDLGSGVRVEPKLMGSGQFYGIRDTVEAVCALYQPPE